MDPHIRKEVSLDSKGPLGAVSTLAPSATDEANSTATSRTGSRENLCEECIQNPLDLIDASIQVDLSDSEAEDSETPLDNKEDAMGRRRAGDLSVNKKGTPLYSREDIREQYCINDKELQVLDKSGRRSILGCFSNNGQAGLTPCTSGGKGKKSILPSCIARTGSEEELQELAKRPISPGHRGTTWNGNGNGRHHGGYDRGGDRHPDEDEGFDEHYFRRRPKSVCMSNDGRRFIPPTYGGLPPNAPSSHLPPQALGIEQQYTTTSSEEQHQRPPMTMAYGPHPLLRAASPYVPNYYGGYPPPATAGPPTTGPATGGYTLPPTAAYFPITAYTNNTNTNNSNTQPNTASVDNTQQVMMSQDSLNQQPNTPDLLMHRRTVDPDQLAADDRKQKHVSFDSSSLMRSQTLATMDEASFQRMAAVVASQTMAASSPSKSSERLIDGRKTPEFELYSQIFPPELARQIMMDRLKRNAMRTQATQTDRNRSQQASKLQQQQREQQQQQQQKIYMVSEGVQTNGITGSRHGSSSDQSSQMSPPTRSQPPVVAAVASSSASIRPPVQPPLPPYTDPPAPPLKNTISPRLASQLPSINDRGYQLQVYHIDGDIPPPNSVQQPPAVSWYGTAPRSGKHHHNHHKHSHHSHGSSSGHSKASRSHSSGNVVEDKKLSPVKKVPSQQQQQTKVQQQQTHKPKLNLQKSYSDGELLEDEPSKPPTSTKAVKFVQPLTLPSNHQSEDDVSDRDLPELAPIEDYERAKICQQQHQLKLNNQKHQKIDIGTTQDDEPDLGQKLSPFGSTSSLQDLVEASSARASVDPNSQSSTSWIDKERQKVTTSGDQTTKPVIKPKKSRSSSKEFSRSKSNSINSDQRLTPAGTSQILRTKPEKEVEDEEETEEVENVEHYLESPSKEVIKEENDEKPQEYTAICKLQMKSNIDTGLDDQEKVQQPPTPTHSLASSSCGSYSVTPSIHNTPSGTNTVAGLPEKSPQTEISPENPTHQQEDELTPQQELPDQKSLIKMTEFTLPDSEKGPQEVTPVQDLPDKISNVELSKAVEIEGEKQQQPESVEEIDIDLEDPEVGMAALKIQAKFRKKSKSPSPAKAKLLSENNLEIGQQQEITPIRGMPEMPTQIQMTSSQDIATVQEPVEEIDIDLEDPEVGKAALMIQSKFREKDGGGGGGGFFKKSKSPSPAAKKSQQPSKEKSPQIEQQPTVVKTVLVSKHVQPEPEEEIDIDLADPEVGKAALMIQSKFRKKGGAAAGGGGFFKKASKQPSKRVPVTDVFPEKIMTPSPSFPEKVMIVPTSSDDEIATGVPVDPSPAPAVPVSTLEAACVQEEKADTEISPIIQSETAKRKQELTLDLNLEEPPQMVHKEIISPLGGGSEESSENSMIWQRVQAMGSSGDVKKKREAFEKQIQSLSVELSEQQSASAVKQQHQQQNGSGSGTASAASAAHKVARQIMDEEAATTSPGMARSPAMHQGFRQEEWVVERTPVNTPDDKVVLVGMINLSDEETSNHVDSDVVFKSSTAATSPQEGESIFDSMADLPPDDTTNRLNTEETEMVVSESAPAKLGSPLESADGGDLISHSEIDQELQVVIMDPSVELVEASESEKEPISDDNDMIVEAENDHETKEDIDAQLNTKNQAEIDVQQKVEKEAILMAEHLMGIQQADIKAQLKAEEEAKYMAEIEAQQKAQEEAIKQAEIEAQKKAEEEAKVKAEEDAMKQAEITAQHKVEEESKLKARDEAIKQAEIDAQLFVEEQVKIMAEIETQQKSVEDKIKAEEEAKNLAEVEAKQKAEQEAKIKAQFFAEQAQIEAQQKAEEAKLKSEEEAMKQTEIETQLKSEEEAKNLAGVEAQQKACEEARIKAEEDAMKPEEIEAQIAKQKAEELEEEETKIKAEEEAMKQREVEDQLKSEEEAKNLGEVEEQQIAEEDARKKEEIEAQLTAEIEAQQKAEQKARTKAEEYAMKEEEIEAQLKVEEEDSRQAENEAKLIAEEESMMQAEFEALQNAEDAKIEAQQKEDDDIIRKKAEEDAKVHEEIEALQKAEDALKQYELEAQKNSEDQARHKAEVEEQQKAEEEAKEKTEEEAREQKAEEARYQSEVVVLQKAEEEEKIMADEEYMKQAENEARYQAELEAQRKSQKESEVKAEDEGKEQEEIEARHQAECEEEQKAEEQAKEQTKIESQQKAEEESKIRAEEEAKEHAEIESQQKAEFEARYQEELDAQQISEEDVRIKAEEETILAQLMAEEAKKHEEIEVKAEADAELKAQQNAEEEALKETEIEAQLKAENEKVDVANEKSQYSESGSISLNLDSIRNTLEPPVLDTDVVQLSDPVSPLLESLPPEGEDPNQEEQQSMEHDDDEPPPIMLVAQPPIGFEDSPSKTKASSSGEGGLILPGFHEAVPDQPLPQEEQLLMASEELVSAPSLHITEAFQTGEPVYSAQIASIENKNRPLEAAAAPTSTTTATNTTTSSQSSVGGLVQSLDRQKTRKLSSTSTTSRPSTAASKNTTSRSRSRSSSKERLLETLAGSENAPQTCLEEDEVAGLYIGGYDRTTWAFIGKLSSDSNEESKMVPLQRSESMESTMSEREFRKRYQAITHRMVHRKSSAVMYSRILERTFECNKTVQVLRVRGEFGFRIHGSRPVVVSAIEPNTPAETSGLEVGDIILTINGINVLDLPHTEVVKTAQTGCDELELGLARVQDLSTEQIRSMDPMNVAYTRLDDSLRILISGYLWKLSRSIMPTTTPGSASALVSKWSRRFFVLRADSCLYFFKKEQDSRPLGATLISGCSISTDQEAEAEDEDSTVTKPFTFRLKIQIQNSNPSLLCLAAENQDNLNQWVHTLQHCSQTINKDQNDLWMEMSKQKMKLSPVDFDNVDCRGYLVKLDSISKSWKKRFCILSDAFLYLYVDKETDSALGSLCLHGYRVQPTASLGGNKRHTFELIPPNPNLKNFYFVADTETEKKRWMASFEYSIDQWMKLS